MLCCLVSLDGLLTFQVTRKIIKRCVSSDGVEREEVMVEGTPQDTVSVAQGDGYSKVIKRTVLKSEGDQTEVCVCVCVCVCVSVDVISPHSPPIGP